MSKKAMKVYVVVQFYRWLKFYFPLFWGMVMYMYDNEFKTKKIKSKPRMKLNITYIQPSMS